MRVAVIGATSGIAHACLRQWAARGAEVRLVARDAGKLERIAADLTARGSATAETLTLDISSAEAVETAVDWVFAAGKVDVVLIAFGTMPPQEEADASLGLAVDLLTVNGVLNLAAAHAVALRLEQQQGGAVAVIGSVAGDLGRQSNYLYGAAKAMVATGTAGLQHRYAGTGVHVTLVKPGPTETPMTDHLKGGRMKLAAVETVAHDIVQGVERHAPVVYTPRKWRLIMTVIRLVPRRVFERTKL